MLFIADLLHKSPEALDNSEPCILLHAPLLASDSNFNFRRKEDMIFFLLIFFR